MHFNSKHGATQDPVCSIHDGSADSHRQDLPNLGERHYRYLGLRFTNADPEEAFDRAWTIEREYRREQVKAKQAGVLMHTVPIGVEGR